MDETSFEAVLPLLAARRAAAAAVLGDSAGSEPSTKIFKIHSKITICKKNFIDFVKVLTFFVMISSKFDLGPTR